MGWRSMEAKHMDRSLRVSFDPGSENDVICPEGEGFTVAGSDMGRDRSGCRLYQRLLQRCKGGSAD